MAVSKRSCAFRACLAAGLAFFHLFVKGLSFMMQKVCQTRIDLNQIVTIVGFCGNCVIMTIFSHNGNVKGLHIMKLNNVIFFIISLLAKKIIAQ
jgi:uncharacterized membrane protein